MAQGTLLYSQSGGVTAVINATASGVITEARSRGIKVLAARNGILGALREDLVDTSKETATAIRGLAHTPGGAFGSCRYKLKSVEEDAAKYERLLDVFRAHDVRWFLYNGGNDSADTANKVSKLAARFGYPLTCIGVPKTIDNDLAVTDCCPGFGSAAKYTAVSVREAALDVAEGADFLMVKPALPYLDVIRLLRDKFPQLPLAAYNVSGEYAMIRAAAANGWLDERGAVLEALTGIRRAGADLIITYHALDAARWLQEG